MKPIIEVNHLSKKYRYGESKPYYTLRDTLTGIVKAPLQLFNRNQKQKTLRKNEFWALKDISFNLNRGDVLGIIGPNGSGKSTLLKVLSQITPPTKGEAILRGRVGSLLEVGTGFQQELTGRENIYLNGAILGMKRSEINRKFEEIVNFSGVEKFLDTPVKHYSSGMYMRLAFAVAAHLDSEILIVDEVLAVGDSDFQKKCLGKMENISKNEGRTVLFVSHNMGAVTSLCSKAIVLESGRIVFNGKTSDSVAYYLNKGTGSQKSIYHPKGKKKIGDEYASLLSGSVRNLRDITISEVDINESFKVCMEFEILKKTKRRFLPQVNLFTSGTQIFAEYYQSSLVLIPGKYRVEFIFPGNFFNDLTYSIALGMTTTEMNSIVHFYETDALSFSVKDPIESTPGPRQAGYTGEVSGLIRPQFEWTIKKINK